MPEAGRALVRFGCILPLVPTAVMISPSVAEKVFPDEAVTEDLWKACTKGFRIIDDCWRPYVILGNPLE